MPDGIWSQRCDKGRVVFLRDALMAWMEAGMPKRTKGKR